MYKVYALNWNKVYRHKFLFHTANNKSMPLTSRKHTCGFLHWFPTFAGCHTQLKCDNACVGPHDVFAYGSTPRDPRVQFAANVTKPSSDKIKEGSE